MIRGNPCPLAMLMPVVETFAEDFASGASSEGIGVSGDCVGSAV